MEKSNETSIIQTQNVGFLVSVSRTVKTGTTAAEISSVKIEGHAIGINEALDLLNQIDNKTKKFIADEPKPSNIGVEKSKYIGQK